MFTVILPSLGYLLYAFYLQQVQQIPLDSIFPIVYSREMKAYLNASEISKLLKVDRATVTRWAKKGVLRGAIQVKGTHQWRIPLSAYEEVVKHKQVHKK
jgi:excisionase family DNA binding protein